VSFIVGVDLAQTNDFTAIAVLERLTHQARAAYHVRHLERLPRMTPYPEQVARVSRVMTRLEDARSLSLRPGPPATLVIDQTGVGRAVADLLRQAGYRSLLAVTIHGGDATLMTTDGAKVPKRELVSVLQVLLQTGRLQVAASLPEAKTLAREMLAFKVTIGDTGHDAYSNDARVSDHDDLVLAVALAAWAGENRQQPMTPEVRRRVASW
jgi:hypothetical protein